MLQSVVGFAYALFATPILVLAGIPLPQSMAIVATAALVQSLTGVRKLRHDVDWRLALAGTVIRYAGTAVGAVLLRQLVQCSSRDIRFVVGAILLSAVGTQVGLRLQPREHIGRVWDITAFSLSGVLAGLVGMGGPPLVLWVMAHTWSAQRTRALLFALFLFALPFQIAVLLFMFGTQAASGVLAGAVLSPLVVVGSLLGLRLGRKLPKQHLRTIAYAILFCIGVAAVMPRVLQFVR